MVYEDEIPKELKVGNVYTAQQIKHFLIKSSDVIILSDMPVQEHLAKDEQFKVTRKVEGYIRESGYKQTLNLSKSVLFLLMKD